ncbi:MAG: GNAT family N-acetyltransferase [Betaproteobacteria bacterium]
MATFPGHELLHAGITIRRATVGDAEAIARVRIDGWRRNYRGLVPQASLDAMSVEASLPLWQRVLAASLPGDVASVFVAQGESGVVGFAAGNRLAEPKVAFDAELTAVYLAHDVQRRGLGRRLVGTIAAERAARGATGMIAWVLAGNQGARQFFEAIGGSLVVEQPFEWDGMPMIEAGYGWRDLATLVGAAGLKRLH